MSGYRERAQIGAFIVLDAVTVNVFAFLVFIGPAVLAFTSAIQYIYRDSAEWQSGSVEHTRSMLGVVYAAILGFFIFLLGPLLSWSVGNFYVDGHINFQITAYPTGIIVGLLLTIRIFTRYVLAPDWEIANANVFALRRLAKELATQRRPDTRTLAGCIQSWNTTKSAFDKESKKPSSILLDSYGELTRISREEWQEEPRDGLDDLPTHHEYRLRLRKELPECLLRRWSGWGRTWPVPQAARHWILFPLSSICWALLFSEEIISGLFSATHRVWVGWLGVALVAGTILLLFWLWERQCAREEIIRRIRKRAQRHVCLQDSERYLERARKRFESSDLPVDAWKNAGLIGLGGVLSFALMSFSRRSARGGVPGASR